MKRRLDILTTDQSSKYARVSVAPRGHPISLHEGCTTPATAMRAIATHTDKNNKILFRPREEQTELANGKPTDPLRSERYIIFDCFILPAKIERTDLSNNVQRRVANDSGKGQRPEIGEYIEFHLRRVPKNDTTSIRVFEGRVEQVVWGDYAYWDEDRDIVATRHGPNVGYIKVLVNEEFDRSLIIPVDNVLNRLSKPIGA